jgi:geranylgeranyl diphosphate synthase type I
MTLPIEIKRGEIVDYLEKLKPEIDRVIEKYLPKRATKRWLEFVFGKPRYTFSKKAAQKALIEPTWEFLSRGGKRWRPVLFLLITEAVGGDVKKVKDFVVIPELIHEGSIIVDDLEDQGELRRGKPCLHKIFGEDIAINAGNFLYFFPLLALIKNKNKFKPKVINRAYEVYNQEMINIHLGQGTDIYWHKGKAKKITEKEYLQMCAFKTGCLSRMAAKLAIILSEGSEKIAEAAGKVAEAMGVAFQIQDDILDITLTGKEREGFGKSFGNDIKEGKRTLMVIHTLKKATKRDKKRLIEILNKHTDDLEERKEAIEIIKKYDSIEYAKGVAKKIMREAWETADRVLKPSPAKKRLNEFINYLIERQI